MGVFCFPRLLLTGRSKSYQNQKSLGRFCVLGLLVLGLLLSYIVRKRYRSKFALKTEADVDETLRVQRAGGDLSWEDRKMLEKGTKRSKQPSKDALKREANIAEASKVSGTKVYTFVVQLWKVRMSTYRIVLPWHGPKDALLCPI